MKTRILLPFLFAFCSVTAQVYHPMLGNNVEWRAWVTQAFIMPDVPNYFTTSGDTSLGGFTYKKIRYNGGNYLYYMREDSAARKVYGRILTAGQQADRLFYEFSLNQNDSVYITWLDGSFGPSGKNGFYDVDSVATINTLAGPRKYMRLSKNGYDVQEWLEGVGHLNNYPMYPWSYCDAYDCGSRQEIFCQTRNGIETFERSPLYACDSGLVYDCTADIHYAHLDSNYTFSAIINGVGPYTYEWQLKQADSTPYTTIDSSFYPSANFTLLRNHRYYIYLTVESDTTICPYGAGFTFVEDTLPANTNPCNAFFWVYPDTVAGSYFAVDYSTGSNLTYLRDFGDGSTSNQQSPSHQYNTAGRYTICLTVDDGNGCTSTYCDSSFYDFNKVGGGPMSVLNVLGGDTIDGIQQPTDVSIRLFPNPAENVVWVQIGGKQLNNARLLLYDLPGKEVISVGIPNNSISLDVSSLPRGYYFYQLLHTGGVATTGKLVVAR